MLAAAATGLRLYQASGLQALVRRSGLAKLLPGTLPAWEALMPSMPPASERAALPPLTAAQGARRGRVALLTGCVQSVVFGAHNRATARVLARNGWDVVAPAGQGCCGALNAHGGDHARAVAMAKATIATFEAAQVDAVIVNTSGCGAHMKAFGHLLAGERGWAERAAAFAKTVQDVAEFLAREPLRGPLRPQSMTVTYHDPCHVVHGQKIRRQPRALLAQLPGVRVVDLPESDWCCGSAGIYNLTQPEMADRLLRRKTRNIESTRAEAVITANPGCILQIQAGLRDRDLDIPVLHLVELLDRAYGGGDATS
jgi:glycolate oxidase iron-sulfur subunit